MPADSRHADRRLPDFRACQPAHHNQRRQGNHGQQADDAVIFQRGISRQHVRLQAQFLDFVGCPGFCFQALDAKFRRLVCGFFGKRLLRRGSHARRNRCVELRDMAAHDDLPDRAEEHEQRDQADKRDGDELSGISDFEQRVRHHGGFLLWSAPSSARFRNYRGDVAALLAHFYRVSLS